MKMTYTALMKKINNGDAEIQSWTKNGDYVDLLIYPKNLDKAPKREIVAIKYTKKQATELGTQSGY